MKRIQSLIVCFLLFWFWFSAPAQNKLSTYEYWFNNSYDDRQTFSITSAKEHYFIENIDVSALPDGVNVLNIRYKDQNNLYSSTLSKMFYKPPVNYEFSKNLTGYEMWFNNDYGSRQVNSVSANSGHSLFTEIDVSALPDGVNVLNIRYKNENNLYSSTLSKMFYKLPGTHEFSKNLTGYEMWFNNDYESRQINSISAITGHHLLTEVDVSGLPDGVNVLNIRHKNENNLFSSTLSKVFYKMEQDYPGENVISAYKYWFNEDFENAVFVPFQSPAKQISIFEDLDVTHLGIGEHTLHFQFLDASGLWSLVKSDNFTKTAVPVALFSITNDFPCLNSPLQFINESVDSDTWLWDFGDGTTSDEFEPEYTYTNEGEYEIKLTAFDSFSGRENSWSKFVVIENCPETCVNLQFNPGWNLFSVPAEPNSTDLKYLFQPLIDNGSLQKIQDELGNALEDWGMIGGWKNFIGDINPTEGYKIKVNVKDSVEVIGVPVEYPFAIPLNSGWNIMGYPQTIEFDALEVMQNLINSGTLLKVQNEQGNAIEDWGMIGGWKNFIGEFSPGKGFKIKLAANDTLWIEEAYPKSTVQHPETVPTTYFTRDFEGNGMDHMNINITGLPANILQLGDELAVFDGELCVGAISLLPHHFASQAVSIPASANDHDGMPGFTEGNAITLKVWSSAKNKEYLLDPEILKGTSMFVRHESIWFSLEKYATTGLDGELFSGKTEIKCYPNPFNDEITIEIMLHKEEEIQLDIFNQLGQRIKTLSNKQPLPAGSFRFIWNGRNHSNQKVTSGIYYVKFSTESVQKFQNIILSAR